MFLPGRSVGKAQRSLELFTKMLPALVKEVGRIAWEHTAPQFAKDEIERCREFLGKVSLKEAPAKVHFLLPSEEVDAGGANSLSAVPVISAAPSADIVNLPHQDQAVEPTTLPHLAKDAALAA